MSGISQIGSETGHRIVTVVDGVSVHSTVQVPPKNQCDVRSCAPKKSLV